MNTANMSNRGGHGGIVIGQKLAFAAASLAIGISAFVNLLGMEKAILAIAFGMMVLRNGSPQAAPRRGLATLGVVLGVCHILLVLVMLVLFWDEVMRFFEFLERFDAGK